jgi:hypothetical protein
MSSDWYFLKRGFFRTKKIGPISEPDFLHRIERGEISPDTLVSSTTKTHGHWLHVRDIQAANKHWNKTHPTAQNTEPKT